MLRFKMAVVVALACWGASAAAQPCHDSVTCFPGDFCDTSNYTCRPCLTCQKLQREEPPLKKTCYKSIRECGPCLKDLMETVELTCVPRGEGAREDVTREDGAALWAPVGVGVALFLLVAAGALYYIIRKSSLFKLHMNTNIDATLPTRVVASAPPVPPPPYSPTYVPNIHPTEEPESKYPLIKPYQPPFPAFETQDRQEGVVYHPPAYVRLPPEHSLTPQYPANHNDENGNYSRGGDTDTDDDTRPSAWTAASNNNQPIEGAAGEVAAAAPGALSAALAAARRTDLIQPASVAVRLQPADNGEERAAGEDSYTQHGAHDGAAQHGNGNYNVMNVNLITIIKPPL